MTTSAPDLSDMPPCPWCAFGEGSPCMAKRMGYPERCLRPAPEPSFTSSAIKTIIAVLIIFLLAAILARASDAPILPRTCAPYQQFIEQGGQRDWLLRGCRWTE